MAMSLPSRFSDRFPGWSRAIFPGAGYSVAQEANASFTIKDGVIHTDDFKVSGKLFGMLGHGDVRFLEDKLDFDIRIDAGGPGDAPDASLQALRIQGRRQSLEADLASEDGSRRIADCRFRIVGMTSKTSRGARKPSAIIHNP